MLASAMESKMGPSQPFEKAPMMIAGNVRPTAPELAAFRQQHPHWLERWEESGPVYRLCPAAINAMNQPSSHGRPPILSDALAAAEHAFFDLCTRDNSAVGLWNGRFISVPYLCGSPSPSREHMRDLGWTPGQITTVETQVKKNGLIQGRLKGYVGWLITEPDFIEAQQALASQWRQLPEAWRPYTLGRLVAQQPPRSRPDSEATVSFQQSLDAFLDRWGLMCLQTWDLPEPQGPMTPALLPPSSPAMPRHGLHFVVPTHYPVLGTDELLHQIRQQQDQLAMDQGLSTSMAGMAHFEVYGQMFEVDFLEKAIVSRYGTPKRPRGLVTAMEHAISQALALSVEQVQKLRKGIAACRAGKRSTVKWLNRRG
jgi:hypothetical protein